MKWKSNLTHYNNIEKCLSLNFGSKHTVKGLATVNLDLNIEIDIILKNQVSMEANSWNNQEAALNDSTTHDNCFLVFIGGVFLEMMAQVLERLEMISKKIGLTPLGLFIMRDTEDMATIPRNTALPLVTVLHSTG